LQSSLKFCDLSFNEIRHLNKYDFFYNRKLEILRLNNNKLTSLNREAFFFNKKLIDLRLDFNYITEIKSNTFDSLTSLRTLNLNYNRLKMLNAATFNPMINLLDLEMQYNSLVDIDYDNFILEKQLVWNLAYNEIGQLSKCNSSVLVICPFGPDEYFYDFEFKILDVSHNKLKKINTFDFSAFALQEVINLSNNQINKIDPEAFKFNNDLEELNLSNNKLRVIEKDVFNGLAGLKLLNLESNKIVNFNNYTLDDSNEIRKVCLYENPIDRYIKTNDICTKESNPKCKVYTKQPCKLSSYSYQVYYGS
jgi:Leucine-rich repeat (LRR) protein